MMIDIEALGGTYIGPIISIGVCTFDENGVANEMEWQLDWTNKANYTTPGMVAIDLSTIKWWLQQVANGNEAPLKDGVHPAKGYSLLLDYISSYTPDLVWAKDPDYDCEHLAFWMEEYGYKWPITPWKQRSVRTVFDLAKRKDSTFHTKPETGTVHTALADAVWQAEAVISAHKILGSPL